MPSAETAAAAVVMVVVVAPHKTATPWAFNHSPTHNIHGRYA
jgi:hypothetical protein